MNVIFTCGGTGGHINPAIAVANLLKERDPNGKILFVGARGGMEEKLVPKAGYELVGLPASSLKRKLTPKGIWQNVQGVGKILSALIQVKKVIREFDADIVVGTGGYASFPALFMASQMGIPTCVHEANAYPGLATRLVADRVDQILVCFEESAKHYKQSDKVKTVGMPVHRDFIETTRAEARQQLGLDERPLVLSAFGSLGAMEMNKAMADFMKLEQDEGFPWQHVHATGKFGWEWMPDLVKEKGVDLEKADGIEMREYIYNMPTLMAAADVVHSLHHDPLSQCDRQSSAEERSGSGGPGRQCDDSGKGLQRRKAVRRDKEAAGRSGAPQCYAKGAAGLVCAGFCGADPGLYLQTGTKVRFPA